MRSLFHEGFNGVLVSQFPITAAGSGNNILPFGVKETPCSFSLYIGIFAQYGQF
jgi:hypothetical protein